MADRRATPRYQQLKDSILERIVGGDWQSGDRIPSEHELTERFSLSRMTVHRALRELTAEGWLERVQGLGTFVAEPVPQSALLEFRDIRDEIVERDHEHSCDVITLSQIKTDAEMAMALGIKVGHAAFHSLLRHRENGRPIQVEDRIVNPAFAPDYLKQDFGAMTPFEYLNDLGPMNAAEHMIEAMIPDRATRDLLELRPGEPVLRLTRRTWSDGIVVSRSRFIYPGPRYRLVGIQDYTQARQTGQGTGAG
jgi:GntR family histidine utilization transcriptional repressor